MAEGNDVGGSAPSPARPLAPPEDTGEALGLPPSGLTLTVGFGRSLFVDKQGKPRFGLDGKLPDGLIELPAFSGDQLDPAISGGDLVIQACANDPQVAVHAVRNLVRIAFGRASVRYSQMGFGRTSSTSIGPGDVAQHARLQGRHRQHQGRDTKGDVEKFVWVPKGDGPDWMVGGSYMVSRKIDMRIEIWDREPLRARKRSSGVRRARAGRCRAATSSHELDFKARAPTASR